ncbi:MAG: hypothetical protein K2X08_07765 [Chlamydiales bacterium]|nr:hypothetical protein [Chlamydiales bacterium]MBY0529661.1 hypothetical protein [Rhabdochlamydiaceae bacterium]
MHSFFLVLLCGLLCVSWFGSTTPEAIPIVTSNKGTPLAMIEIQGEKYPLKLDLGAKAFLMLDQSLISKIDLTKYGSTKWIDLRGNAYQTPRYLASKIKIGRTVFNDVLLEEQPVEFSQNTFFFIPNTIQKIKTEKSKTINNEPMDYTQQMSVEGNATMGAIGRPILKRKNLLLDFPHKRFYLLQDNHSLKDCGICLEKMIKVPFIKSQSGIVFSIKTDLGELRFLLDTGTTLTLIRASLLENHVQRSDWDTKNRVKPLQLNPDKKDSSLDQMTNEGEAFQNSRNPTKPLVTAFETQKFAISGVDLGKSLLYAFELSEEISDIDGVLGMDFLGLHQIYIDYFNSTLYLSER